MEQALKFSLFSICLLLAFYWLGVFSGWESNTWWFDIVLHFLGGALVASVSFHLASKYWRLPMDRDFFTGALLVFCFVALVGVFWELFEFGFDRFIYQYRHLFPGASYLQASVADTVLDLVMDLLGGAVFILFNRIFNISRK